MNLFDGESIVSQSNDNTVTLTTHRICNEEKGFSQTSTKNIMLEHITSCETQSKRYYLFLLLAIVGVFLSILPHHENDANIFGAFAIVVGLCLFLLVQKKIIKISSPTSTININVNSLKQESITAFVDKIELTKHKRIVALNGKTSIVN